MSRYIYDLYKRESSFELVCSIFDLSSTKGVRDLEQIFRNVSSYSNIRKLSLQYSYDFYGLGDIENKLLRLTHINELTLSKNPMHAIQNKLLNDVEIGQHITHLRLRGFDSREFINKITHIQHLSIGNDTIMSNDEKYFSKLTNLSSLNVHTISSSCILSQLTQLSLESFVMSESKLLLSCTKLEELTIGRISGHHQYFKIPDGITSLIISDKIQVNLVQIPSNLQQLVINTSDIIPNIQTLKYLILTTNRSIIENLSNNIQYLHIQSYDQIRQVNISNLHQLENIFILHEGQDELDVVIGQNRLWNLERVKFREETKIDEVMNKFLLRNSYLKWNSVKYRLLYFTIIFHNLPAYVILWIFDWLPSYQFITHHKHDCKIDLESADMYYVNHFKKIRLIERTKEIIRHIKNTRINSLLGID